MSKKWNKRRRQTTLRGSDSRIVPQPAEGQSEGEKPGNAGVGKAAGISRDPDRAPPVLSDGTSVLTRLDCSPVLAAEARTGRQLFSVRVIPSAELDTDGV